MPDKTTKPICLSADDAATQALQPAIEWAKKYGRMTDIAATLGLATNSNVSRQMVGRWLNPDPEKRVQTNLGMGLMLLHVVALLSAEDADQRLAAESGLIELRLTRAKGRTTKTKTPSTNAK